MRIDTHQHFWLYDPSKHEWITDNMSLIRKDFLPNDIAKTLKDNAIDGIVAVQADQSHQETDFLVELSQVYKLIKGVVGWVDLRSEDIEEHLAHFSKSPIIKGFRHVVEGEADGDFLIRPNFQKGLEALTKHGYTYDLLVRPIHYAATLTCVENNPSLSFMLDHMAKPPIKVQEFDEWAEFIKALAKFPNVYCKISGLTTEADWKNWKLDHFKKYIAHVIDCFGKQRICFGTDWPVSLLATSYEQIIEIVEDNLSDFTVEELNGFWGDNATKFYNLK